MMSTKRSAFTLLCFLLIALSGTYWTQMDQRLIENEQRLLLAEVVGNQAAAIERRVSLSMTATYILAQEIRHNDGLFRNFERYAEQVIQSIGGISNLQLAPDGVIARIHPLAGNEKAIGHNILRDDRRREEAREAIIKRRLTLAGPFELIQGGTAIVGRNPVFLNEGAANERFWGFTSTLIFLDELLRSTELAKLEQKGYRYTLSRRHAESGALEVFARSAADLTETVQSAPIQVPNGEWLLSMSRAAPVFSWTQFVGFALSFLAASLASVALNYVLRQPQRLQREVKEKTRALERLVHHDHLTGLPNRRYLNRQLQQVLEQAREPTDTAALLYLDLDDFKRVNDLMGHSAGDQLLQELSERMGKTVGRDGFLARLGGDEFALLLTQVQSRRAIAELANRLIDTIEQPVMLEHREFAISASIGITLLPTDGDDPTVLLRNADMAMYDAKHRGKHRFSFFDAQMQQLVLRKLRLEQEMRGALRDRQFELHYQPLVCLNRKEIRGYEALIRWRHPEKGLLYPDAFIGLAEETGLIRDIGYWVIAEAARTLRQRQLNGAPPAFIAINLSPQQFSDKRLAEVIDRTLNSAGVPPQLLEIEITETSIMENLEHAVDTLKQLKETGLSVAIDDFGTGYSSLAMLKQLPVDKIKIDRSFIRDMEHNRVDQRIVAGLIKMIHSLNRVVVAEGIETEAQQQLLRRFGCDYGQGYLFSRPLPLARLPSESSVLEHAS